MEHKSDDLLQKCGPLIDALRNLQNTVGKVQCLKPPYSFEVRDQRVKYTAEKRICCVELFIYGLFFVFVWFVCGLNYTFV